MKKETPPFLRSPYDNQDCRRPLKRVVPWLSLGSLSLFTLSVQAADKYVRKGATGANNGTDWTNAYNELSQVSYSGLSGFTLYIAEGTYTTNLPSMNNVDNCTIRRATVATHGTATGWNNAYDGQVTASNTGKFVYMSGCDNVVFDGGGTKEPWLFRIVGQTAYNGKFEIQGGSNITIRYLDMDGNGCQPNEVNGPEDGFRIGGTTNLILEHNWIHNYYYCTGSGNVGHSDGIHMPSVNGCIIRYNKFQDSGMLLYFGDCTWANQYADNVHVHHNIFIQQAGTLAPNESNYRVEDHKGITRTSAIYWISENNTYYAASGSGVGGLYENTDCPGTSTRRIIRNNILINMDVSLSGGVGTAQNNQIVGGTVFGTGVSSANPLFVNQAGLNFRLQAGSPCIDTGVSTVLGYGENITAATPDYDGVPIGAQRSRGAFEYETGAPGPVPSSPEISVSPNALNFGTVLVGTNVSLPISVTNTGTGTLTGSASVSTPFSIVSGGTYSLGADQTQTVVIRYAPTSTGLNNGSASFSGAGGASASVSGTAQQVLSELTFDSTSGTITSPFVANGSGYISQPDETGLTGSGRAVYVVNIPSAGDYTISANVNAPHEGANSLFINIDAEPTDPAMIWDIPLTTGFQDRTVSWRGNGTFSSAQYTTKVFSLSAGTHQLIVRGREMGTQLRRITLAPATSSPPPAPPSSPSNLRVVPGG